MESKTVFCKPEAWIKIEKGGDAPKYKENVLVALKNGTVCMARYENFVFWDLRDFELKNVTYWTTFLPTHPDYKK